MPQSDEVFYDLDFDWDIIEASFAMQYGIRLSAEEIGLAEFLRLLRGIMPDTPLGRVVALRVEGDAEVLAGRGLSGGSKPPPYGDDGGLEGLQDELARVFG